MAHFRNVFVVVLTLAILSGACAEKMAKAEIPSQPDPTVSEGANLPAKQIAPPASEALRDRLKQEQKLERADRKSRYLQNDEEAYARFQNSEKGEELSRRAERIEEEYADKRVEKLVKKHGSPAEKLAFQEMQKEEKELKVLQKAYELGSVMGCDDTKIATPKVEQKPSIWSTSYEVTLVNTSDIPWHVRTESRRLGTIVWDVCVGGSLGLHFSRSAWQDFIDGNFRTSGRHTTISEQILLVAVAEPITNERGVVRVPTPQTFSITLNRRSGRVSRTGLFKIRGSFLPRPAREARVVPQRAPRQAEPRVEEKPEAVPPPKRIDLNPKYKKG